MADAPQDDTNPRAIIGHNSLAAAVAGEQTDFAALVTDYLEGEYRKLRVRVKALLAEATALLRGPDGKLMPIPDDDTKGKVKSLIKRMRDCAKEVQAAHDKEKTNYLRGGQGVDMFFYADHDLLARRDRKAKAGAADVLNDMLTDYDTMLLRLEQERRQRIAAEEERKAREARAAEELAARKAEEARRAAERARTAETTAAKTAVAALKDETAAVAAANSEVAFNRAQDARVDTFAKASDIMRDRGADGVLSTMQEEPYAEIEDDTLLDMAKLWPFIKLEAKEQALRAWAKTTGWKPESMPGAKIGRRPKSRVR